MSDLARDWKLFIDGRWSDGGAGTFAVINPATEETVAQAPNASVADVERAIAAARRAFDDGPWRRTTPQDRARVIERLVAALETRRDRLREILIATAGATWVSHPIQLDLPYQLLANYADLVRSFHFEEMLPVVVSETPMGTTVNNSMVYHQAAGVCALIPTWNFPFFTTVQKIGPALAAGCTMVIKPSPYGPLVDLVVAEAIEECELPPGVVNVVTGDAPALGAALVESPLVDKISFTGSAVTGKRIMAAAAPTLKRVHLELGGKSVAIVLDDIDLMQVVPYASSPAFFHAGQGCAMCTRFMIPRARQDAAAESFAGFLGGMVSIGDPADPGTMLGPVIREERRQKIEEYIALGHQEGARLVTGGGRPADRPRGYFLQPTVFADVRNEMRIAREEIFGPVLSILPFDDVDQAVRIANDSPYGLGGAVYANDVAKALAVAKQLRTGTVNINAALNLLNLPFGGFKESGIGREGGRWGIAEYTEAQAIAWK
ncbi:aldehyde dehydrogenase family protein [bacterium]|nr:aldehyde dehydrogenase family protein [bacterium]